MRSSTLRLSCWRIPCSSHPTRKWCVGAIAALLPSIDSHHAWMNGFHRGLDQSLCREGCFWITQGTVLTSGKKKLGTFHGGKKTLTMGVLLSTGLSPEPIFRNTYPSVISAASIQSESARTGQRWASSSSRRYKWNGFISSQTLKCQGLRRFNFNTYLHIDVFFDMAMSKSYDPLTFQYLPLLFLEPHPCEANTEMRLCIWLGVLVV